MDADLVRVRRHRYQGLVAGLALTGLLGGGGLLGDGGFLDNLLGGPGSSGSGGSGSGSGGSSQVAGLDAADFRSMARLDRGNGTLRRGCRSYAYRYRIRPPAGAENWSIEVLLRGPRGGRVASDVLLSGADPRRGRKTLRICRQATRPGVFTLRGKVTVQDHPDSRSGWATPTTFRLRPPGR